MKKHKLLPFLILCILLLPLCASACKNKQDRQEKETADEQAVVYVPSFSDFEYSLASNPNNVPNIWYIFVDGSRIYAIAHPNFKEDILLIFDQSTKEQSQRTLEVNGSRYFQTLSGFMGYNDASKQLILYDKDFEQTDSVDLHEFYETLRAKNKTFSCSAAAVDLYGTIGLLSQDELFFINKDGALLFSIECPENLRSLDGLAVTADGQWYTVGADTKVFKQFVYPVDTEHYRLKDAVPNMPPLSLYDFRGFWPADGNALYLLTENYLYLCEPDKQESREILCLRDYGISFASNYHGIGFGLLEQDGFATVSADGWEADEADLQMSVSRIEVMTLSAKNAEEVQPRTEIVIASLFEPNSGPEKEWIKTFNRHNTRYYVTVKVYENSQLFYNDLITGNSADIFVSYKDRIDFENLAEKGGLADLYSFIDSDTELERGDFIPNVLKALEYDGKLYGLTTDFSLFTLAGKVSLLEQYSKWDFDSMYRLIEEHPGAALISADSHEQILDTLLSYSADSFYNLSEGTCSFDSPEFIRLLEAVISLPIQNVSYTELPNLLHNETVLLYPCAISYAAKLQEIWAFLGEKAVYAGYPSGDGGRVSANWNYSWAISAQSQHQEAAWEFIRGFFSENYQSNLFFPVLVQCFEEQLENEQIEPRISGIAFPDGTKISFEPATAEDVQTIRELVYSAAWADGCDNAIRTIVMDEAQAFFAGQRTAEETAKLIQERVKNYVEEKQ